MVLGVSMKFEWLLEKVSFITGYIKHWDEPTLEATLAGVAQPPAILGGKLGQEARKRKTEHRGQTASSGACLPQAGDCTQKWAIPG